MNQKRQNISIEMLSAYLDNQLTEKERSKVDSALQVDPSVKYDLDMLDATRRLLRNAPTLKVPHNFTLTPSMVSKKNPFHFWMPAMSFSSAVAAILLVLTYVFNFNTVGTSMVTQSRSMDMLAASDTVNMESMEMADDSGTNTAEEPPMIIQWNNPQAGGMGGGGPAAAVAGGEMMAEEALPMAAEAPAPEADITTDMAIMATPEMTFGEEMPAEEPSVAMEQEAPAVKNAPDNENLGMENNTGDATSNLILGVSPENERGQIIDDQPEYVVPAAGQVARSDSHQNTVLQILRGSLLLLSIAFAGIAILMHRQKA